MKAAGIQQNLPVNKTFQGSYKKTEHGNPYYHSNSGTVAGSILAVPAALMWLLKLNYKKPSENEILETTKAFENLDSQTKKIYQLLGIENMNDAIQKEVKMGERLKKYAIPFAVVAAGLTVGCGMLVDNIRNKKAQENANYARQVGVKKALATNAELSISEKGRPYTKTNPGVKYGALLGAGCGIVNSFMSMGKNIKTGFALMKIISFSIGGLLMGAIADSAANKSARKNA